MDKMKNTDEILEPEFNTENLPTPEKSLKEIEKENRNNKQLNDKK